MSASQQLLLGNSYTNPWEIEVPWPDGFDPQTVSTTRSFSLLDGGRTFRVTNDGASYLSAIRAYGKRNTGKWYWEIVVNLNGNSTNTRWLPFAQGVTGSPFDTSSAPYLGFQAAPASSSPSNVTKAGSTTGSGFSPNGQGVLWQFAVDLDAQQIWIGNGTAWFRGGNPSLGSTPTLGFGSGLSGGLSSGMSEGTPCVDGASNFASGISITGNFSAASQVYAPPTGFLPWASGNMPVYSSPDSFLSDTQLILNAQGTAGSSAFLDESIFARAVTARNGLILDTTPAPALGTTSLIGNGVDRNAIIPFTNSFTTKTKFLFEGFFRFTALGTGTQRFVLMGVCNNANPTLQSHYNIYLYWQNPNLGIRVGSTDYQFNASSFISAGAWTYISFGAIESGATIQISDRVEYACHIGGIGRYNSNSVNGTAFSNNQCINVMGLRDAGTIDMYAFNGQAQCLRFTTTSRYTNDVSSPAFYTYPVPTALLPGRFSSPAVSRTVLLSGLQATAQQGIAESQNKTISLTGLQASSQVGVSAIRGWPYLQSTTYLPSNNIKTGNWFSDATITLSITNDGLVNIVASGTNALGQPTNYNLSSFWAQELNGSYPVAGFFAQNIRAIVTYTDDGNWVGIPAYGSSVFLGTTQTYTYTLATSNTTPTVRRIGVGIQLVADGLLLGQVFAAAGSAVFSPTVATIVLYFDIGRI